jgi:hypothetical protein
MSWKRTLNLVIVTLCRCQTVYNLHGLDSFMFHGLDSFMLYVNC